MSTVGRLETGVIFCGENLDLLQQFPASQIDLIYLDPPFFSNRFYEVIWGDEAEVRSFEDRWKGGIDYYIDWMRQRVVQMHRLLKPTGALYLHCDTAASHYLKVMLDRVFGSENFRNEVIWKRTSAHSSAKRYGPVHDSLLFYTRSNKYTWNPSYQEYDPYYLEQFYTHVDASGRRWRRSDLTGAGIRNGETGKPWRGIDVTAKGRHWAYPPDDLDRLDSEGKIHWPKKDGGMPMFKRYADEQSGVPLQDVWTDIRPMHNLSRERVGYPTQKPLALLNRIVSASSNRGDVVLDPFCGCGTTLVAAERLHREWIGIDISPTAVRVMRRRLDQERQEPVKVYDLPETEDDLKNLKPFEFQNWIVQTVHGTHSTRRSGDLGIDGYSFFERFPIQVKQSEKVGRNVVDNFETAIRREGIDKGYIIAFSFGRGAYQEAARAKQDGLEIELVTVATLLANPPDERDKPVDPKLPDLTKALILRAREAAGRATHREAPPAREAEELIASARGIESK